MFKILAKSPRGQVKQIDNAINKKQAEILKQDYQALFGKRWDIEAKKQNGMRI